MAVSTTWIRHNMLGSPQYQKDRKLSEMELRVQRSLQKLSIPDWYLNKQSDPPKILSNLTPIECRPPSWKNPGSRRNCNTGTMQTNTDTYVVSRSPRKSSKQKRNQKEIIDTQIPKIKLRTNISKTFPKVSPSRKIQNINIVFPPGPPINIMDLSGADFNEPNSKYDTFVLDRRSSDQEKHKEEEENNNDTENQPIRSPGKIDNCSFNSLSTDTSNVSLKPQNLGCGFAVHAISTPNHTPIKFFSSTLIEDTPRLIRLPCETEAERVVIEDSSNENLNRSFLEQTIPVATPKPRKLFTQSFDERETVGTPRMISQANLIFGKKIRSLEPIVIHRDNNSYSESPRKSSVPVHEIARKFDPFTKQRKVSQKVATLDLNTASPCTRFIYSKKKSVELENIVKNNQPTRGKGLVKGIIEELSEKCKTSTLKQNRIDSSNQNYVRTIVSAIEKGDTLKKSKEETCNWRKSIALEDVESYSESDVKSRISSTSMSAKDTDSSDSDQRSPFLRMDAESKFNYSTMSSQRSFVENQSKGCQTDEEDSVYWIPVTRCELPRSSSLLSMMSRLSTHGQQSPCISPIRSENDTFQSVSTEPWGTTFKKSALSKKLFRIDETVVTDSGYSDKSNNPNSSACSVTDGTWSGDVSNESGTENKSSRSRKSSSRRKTMVGLKSILV